MLRFKLNKKIMNPGFITAGVFLLFAFLFLFFQPSSNLTAQKERWTAETHDKTNFPLVGKHRTTACSECHLKGVMEGTPTDCEACHWIRKQDDRYKLRFGKHCDDCHTPFDWKILKPNSWDHGQVTGFPLSGIHKTMDCFKCHKNNVFTSQSGDCFSCHAEQYRDTSNPNHSASHFPTDCRICHHSMLTWVGARFDHSQFPLKGLHAAAECGACHKNNIYVGLPSTCVSCHLADYDNNSNVPNHKQAGFSLDCLTCHGSDAVTWKGAGFIHAKFILKGNHKTAACADCHKNGIYIGTPSLCVNCHLTEYNNSLDPNHKQAGFSTDCVSCHGSEAISWKGAVFNHSFFQLNGKHLTALCADCHINGKYAGTPNTCVGCHLNNYNGTTNPNHKTAGFSTDCVSCHGSSAISWKNTNFNHTPFWPLQGAHIGLDCNKCHSVGYNLPKDCYGCHKKDYDATTNPNHKSTGFPTSCENCHFSSHTSWRQAVFNHKFPISSGKHGGFLCTDCHRTSNYLVFSCIDCHAHTKSEMDSEHNDINGYSYNSQACYTCHPTGNAD